MSKLSDADIYRVRTLLVGMIFGALGVALPALFGVSVLYSMPAVFGVVLALNLWLRDPRGNRPPEERSE